MTDPLIINNFNTGIADSPHKGFGLMKRVEIEAFPGAVKVQKALTSLFDASFSTTFTADPATEQCTAASAIVPISYNGKAVTLTTTGTLPAGLTTGTNYFMIAVSTTIFKLAKNYVDAVAATPIDITDAGTGVHTVTSVNQGTITHIQKFPNASVNFLHDSNGRVWVSESDAIPYLLNGNTIASNSNGNGLIPFTNSDGSATYLFIFRSAAIDVVDVSTAPKRGSPAVTNGWQALNSGAGTGNRHHAIVGQDNIVYFTDARYVGSIKENSGAVFDPANGATYTYNNQALDVPQGEVLVHLEELGTNLLAAGSSYNKIYPWDRVSDSYNLPLAVPEVNVQRMKNIGGTIYILAGTWGNIYTTQGTYIKFFKKLPDQMTNNSGTLLSNPVTWGGIDAVNGALLFGAGVQTSGNSGAYLLYPDGRLILDQIPTTGSTNVTAFQVSNNFYTIGYASGADRSTTSRYTSFEGVVQSALYRVANHTERASFSTLEVVTAKTLASDSGRVRVSYRPDTNSSFTTIDTFSFNSSSGSPSVQENGEIGIIDVENIQVQAEIDGVVELVELRLYP